MQTRASHTGDLQVSEHRSSLGQWRVAQRRADPRLRDYVHGFVVSEGYLPSAVHEWHIPSLEVAVVLNFAAPHRIVDISDLARTTDYHSGWMAGLQSRHRLTEAVGARDFIVIRFTPIGAHLFLMTPMDLLTDRTIALEEIDRPFTRRFANRVEAARNWDSRLELIEHLVAERIALARPPSLILIDSWRKLMNAPNTIDLPLLASESGCSRRHLIAQFHTHFGMAPKMIARIRRFNLAVAELDRFGRNAVRHAVGAPYLDRGTDAKYSAKMDAPWADLALQCGYYDQSHFIKEFRAFAGVTPARFLRRLQHGGIDEPCNTPWSNSYNTNLPVTLYN